MKKLRKYCGYNCGSNADKLISSYAIAKLLRTAANLLPL